MYQAFTKEEKSLFSKTMESILNEVKLSDLVRIYPMFRTEELANDLAIAKWDFDARTGLFQHPCRFDGYLVIFCTEGEFSVDLNLKTFTVGKNMLFIYEPGNIVKFNLDPDAQDKPVHFSVAAISLEMIQEVEKDISRLYSHSVAIHEDPCLSFSDEEAAVVARYFDLTGCLMKANIPGCREAIHTLASSVVFFLRSFWIRKRAQKQAEFSEHSPRAQETVDKFIRLVTEHHMTEHYLAFYAGKLGITPKYLSKLVREVTGRSAPEWIDSFLVLEAKNMLKYSNMAIKEIVYTMHFPDQSSFYKFFKLHTGMIPSEYRKS